MTWVNQPNEAKRVNTAEAMIVSDKKKKQDIQVQKFPCGGSGENAS